MGGEKRQIEELARMLDRRPVVRTLDDLWRATQRCAVVSWKRALSVGEPTHAEPIKFWEALWKKKIEV